MHFNLIHRHQLHPIGALASMTLNILHTDKTHATAQERALRIDRTKKMLFLKTSVCFLFQTIPGVPLFYRQGGIDHPESEDLGSLHTPSPILEPHLSMCDTSPHVTVKVCGGVPGGRECPRCWAPSGPDFTGTLSTIPCSESPSVVWLRAFIWCLHTRLTVH